MEFGIVCSANNFRLVTSVVVKPPTSIKDGTQARLTVEADVGQNEPGHKKTQRKDSLGLI